MSERCRDCWEIEHVIRSATTVRGGNNLCDVCAVDWDIPISPGTEARFRKDATEYRVQPGWMDSVSVLHELDRVRAERNEALDILRFLADSDPDDLDTATLLEMCRDARRLVTPDTEEQS